jgi:hypothetical protein
MCALQIACLLLPMTHYPRQTNPHELIVSPSIGNTTIFFNQTVAQLPKVPNPTANQLTVPLLLRQNFTDKKWYLCRVVSGT